MRHPSPSTLARGILVALALVLAGLVAPAGAGAAPAADTSGRTSAPAVAAKSAPGAWKCTKWKHSASVSVRNCARITSFSQKFDVDYTRTFHNGFKKKTITVQCTTSKTTTWKFGVSATVEAEAGVIFAKAKTSLTGSVERQASTTDTASATFRLKPRKYAHCKRGMYEYSWRGEFKREACHPSQGCKVTKRAKYSAHAPSRDAFFIGGGRG